MTTNAQPLNKSTRQLRLESEVEDITVLNQIIAAFQPHFARFLHGSFRTSRNKVVKRNRLSSNKALLEIRMNRTGSLWRFGTLFDRPGMSLFRPNRKESQQSKQRISRANHPRQPCFRQTKRFEKFLLLRLLGPPWKPRPTSP